jgi:hypothetical protein
MAYIGQDPVIGRYIIVDQISGGFNGTASGFTLAAGGQGVIPGLAQNVILSLGGVIQQPGTDYTVSGTSVTFTTPPLSGTTFFATILGDAQSVGTPSDRTVIPASIATSGTFTFPNLTTTGTTLIASGNASTPSLAIIGDVNTGLYSPGADQLAISTNGTGRLFINSAGSVGIAGAPTSLFSITGGNLEASNSAYNYIQVSTPGLVTGQFSANGSNSVELRATTNHPLLFYTNNTERARIDSSGRLGLGTSSVAALFHAAGAGLFRGSTTGTEATLPTETTALSVLHGTGYNTTPSCSINIGANNRDAVNNNEGFRWGITTPGDATGLALAFSSTSWNGSANVTSERLRITDGGLVGIGTASPGQLLHIAGVDARLRIQDTDNTSVTSTSFLEFSGSDARAAVIYTNSNGLNLQADSASGQNLLFFTAGGNERARIDSIGRFLVGTSSSRQSNGGLQVESTAGNSFAFLTRNVNSSAGVEFSLQKSRGATNGSFVVVAAEDEIGRVNFNGADGTADICAARITAAVDGTPGTNDMPGRLLFSTTADGASSPTERMRITSAGLVGIGTTVPGSNLDLTGTTSRIRWDVNSAFTLQTHANQNFSAFAASIQNAADFQWQIGGTERARIDSSGRLLLGTSSVQATNGGSLTRFQIQGTDAETAGQSVIRHSNSAGGPWINLGKSRATAAGGITIVQDNDPLGTIGFFGADGTDINTAGATIACAVDGTPGVDDMPGRIVLSTTLDGASSPTERFRITNDGVIAHDQPAPAAVNATATLTVANLKAGIITSTSAAATDMTLPTGTDTQAGFSGTYDNFTFEWSVINTGPSLVRVLAGTAHTVVGSGSVATGTSGRFASRRTAANTFVSYRLS